MRFIYLLVLSIGLAGVATAQTSEDYKATYLADRIDYPTVKEESYSAEAPGGPYGLLVLYDRADLKVIHELPYIINIDQDLEICSIVHGGTPSFHLQGDIFAQAIVNYTGHMWVVPEDADDAFLDALAEEINQALQSVSVENRNWNSIKRLFGE